MLTIFKRERAVRLLPISCGLALVLAVVLLPVIEIFAEEPVDQRRTSASAALGAGSISAVLLLIALQTAFVSIRHLPLQFRVQEFERVLPMSMRRIVFERLAATWVALAAPACVASALWSTRLASADLGALGVGTLRVLGAFALGVTLLFSYRPCAPRLHVAEVVVVSILALIATVWAVMPSATWMAVASTAVLLAYLHTTLPWTPRGDDPSIGSATSHDASAPLPVRVLGPLRWTMLRSTFLRPPIVILSVVGGVFIAVARNDHTMLILWFPALIVHAAMHSGMNLMHGVDAFPMRRTRLLHFIALPTLAILVTSFMALTAFPREFESAEMLERGVALDNYGENTLAGRMERQLHVRVPPDLWRFARSAEEARVVSPWGETVDPVPHPVFYGASKFAYCPYDVGPDNSGRFLEWQVTRALREVHEPAFIDITFDARYRDRPLAESHVRDSDSLDWGVTAPARTGIPNSAGFLALCAVLLWFVIAAFTLRPNIPSRSGALGKRALKSQAAGGITLFAVIMLSFSVHRDDRALLIVLATRLHRTIDAALGSSPLLWAALVLTLAGAGYAFLAWRIQRIEVPPLVVNSWTKKAIAIY